MRLYIAQCVLGDKSMTFSNVIIYVIDVRDLIYMARYEFLKKTASGGTLTGM
jgi:hypothetical protein